LPKIRAGENFGLTFGVVFIGGKFLRVPSETLPKILMRGAFPCKKKNAKNGFLTEKISRSSPFPRVLLRFTQMASRSEIRASIFSFPSP